MESSRQTSGQLQVVRIRSHALLSTIVNGKAASQAFPTGRTISAPLFLVGRDPQAAAVRTESFTVGDHRMGRDRAIGGSAAVLLGVHADYALPVAGIALTAFSIRRVQ
jgi:hypothetical protein